MAGWVEDRKLPGDWENRRKRVMRDAKGVCQLRLEGCRVRAREVDHIGDRDDHRLSNLRAVCVPCHRKRTQEQSRVAVKKAWAKARPRPRKHPGLL